MADPGQQQNFPRELQAAIRKETIAQTAKYTAAAVVGLLGLAAAGWWLYLEDKIDKYVTARVGIPASAVAAFDLAGECPTGWNVFSDGADKVIVAAGPHRPFRVPGGNDSLTLKTENLPPHKHETSIGILAADASKTAWGVGQVKPVVAGASFPVSVPAALTSAALFDGKNPPDPINTMPPFIALTVCKKASM